MNKLIFSSILLLGTLVSCAEMDQELLSESVRFNGISTVYIDDGKIVDTRGVIDPLPTRALKFENEEALSKYCKAMDSMSLEERVNLSVQLGVQTLGVLEIIANNELDSIGSISKTEPEFKLKYDLLVKKYDGILLCNYIDPTDLNFYASEGEGSMKNIKYFANSKGEYVVGDVVQKLDITILPRFIEIISSVDDVTDDENLPTNTVTFSPAENKKVKFLIEKVSNDINVAMYVKKKMWHGWIDDKYRWLLFEPQLKNYTQALAPSDNIYWYKGMPNIYQTIGKGLPLETPAATPPKVNGKVYIWTDYSFEFDRQGNPIYDFSQHTGHPIVTRDKAVVVNVSL